MFTKDVDAVQIFLDTKKKEKRLQTLKYQKKMHWPAGGGRNIVLMDDVALELGSPRAGSVSFLLWTQEPGKVKDGRIRVVGPDLPNLYKSGAKEVPFGKIVLLEVEGFDEENTYERYREIEATRFDVDLKGYMMKAASQYQREWSRISREAMKNKFSLSHLGTDLIDRYRRLEYVNAVELLFITSSAADVQFLQETASRVGRIISAMNKMLEEMSFDCSECEYVDVCDEVEELGKLKTALESSGKD